jgi:hypothetical protein
MEKAGGTDSEGLEGLSVKTVKTRQLVYMMLVDSGLHKTPNT